LPEITGSGPYYAIAS